MPYIKPTSDIFIKYLLGTEEHKDLLLSFINAVMSDSGFPLVQSVEIRNPFNIKNMIHGKESILDIKAEDENGKIFNIEMQASGDETFKTRSLYYWAKLYSSQLNEGDKYITLFPVVCINILEFEMFRQFDKYHSTFVLRDIKHPDYILTDHLAIHFIELPKFKNYNINMDKKLEKWLYYLKQEGIEKEDGIMEILIKEDATFKKAHEKYAAFTRDDEMVEAYESHMKWVRDYNTKMFIAKEEGIKIGLEKGKKEGRKEGELKGRKEGELIGKIQILQQILKKPVSDEAKLLQQNINELETLFQNLQKELTIQ